MAPNVEFFDCGWNPNLNKGAVRIKVSSGQTLTFTVTSLSELAGWTSLFSRAPLYIGPSGWIHTSSETIGKEFIEGTEVPFP